MPAAYSTNLCTACNMYVLLQECIVRQGEAGDAFYIVESGEVCMRYLLKLSNT
jgi:CRP-like cAMP-binding protein